MLFHAYFFFSWVSSLFQILPTFRDWWLSSPPQYFNDWLAGLLCSFQPPDTPGLSGRKVSSSKEMHWSVFSSSATPQLLLSSAGEWPEATNICGVTVLTMEMLLCYSLYVLSPSSVFYKKKKKKCLCKYKLCHYCHDHWELLKLSNVILSTDFAFWKMWPIIKFLYELNSTKYLKVWVNS